MRAALVGLLALCACGGRADGEIRAFAPRVDEVVPDAPWVADELEAATRHSHWLVETPADDAPVLALRVGIFEARTPAGAPLLRLEAIGELPEAYRRRFGANVDAVVEVEAQSGEIDRREHGGLALERAIAVLDAKLGLTLAGTDAVGPILAADDGQIAVLGLDWVAAHRARPWADEVARLVDHEDPLVGLRAIECLGLVGEPRHADALVRRPRLSDRAYARRVYDTLAQLGGPTARGFLEFAARNEDDPELAEAAARALDEVGRDRSLPTGRRQERGHR